MLAPSTVSRTPALTGYPLEPVIGLAIGETRCWGDERNGQDEQGNDRELK